VLDSPAGPEGPARHRDTAGLFQKELDRVCVLRLAT